MSRRVYFRDERLVLECEWEDCATKFESVDKFLQHITDHVEGLALEDISCLWRDCTYAPDDNETEQPKQQLLSHALFHGFHTKIKCYGANMMKRDNIGACELDSSGHNLIPDLPTVLQCGWKDCTMSFNNPEFFYRHVNDHVQCSVKEAESNSSDPTGRLLHCFWQGCHNNRVFRELEKLRNHLRSHSQEKMVACPTCGSLFTCRTRLYDHIKRQVVLTEGGFNCEICEKSFFNERLLKTHARSHVFKYSCTMCKFYATSSGNLESHMKFRHSDVTMFKCQSCPKQFKTSYNLKRHQEEIHQSNRKNYHCAEENCNFATRSYCMFSWHYKRTHWDSNFKGYQCHICSKVYQRGNYLTNHLYEVHNYQSPSDSRLRYKQCKDGYYRLIQIHFKEKGNGSAGRKECLLGNPSQSEHGTNVNNTDLRTEERDSIETACGSTSNQRIVDGCATILTDQVPVVNSLNSSDTIPVIVPSTGLLQNQNIVLQLVQPDGSTVVYPVQIQTNASAPETQNNSNLINQADDAEVS